MSGSLVLIVVLLLAPVVLVFAFAGCRPFDAEPGAPPGPTTTPPGTTGPGTTGPGTTGPGTTGPGPGPAKPGDPYRAAILAQPGLIAYWRLAETAGNSAVDSGPFGRNGVFKGGPSLGQEGALAAKQPGDTAVLFGGTDDLVEIDVGTVAGLPAGAPDPLLPPLSFSIEAWVKLAPPPAGGAAGFETVFDSLQSSGGAVRGFSLSVVRGTAPGILGLVGNGATGATLPDLTDDVRLELPADVLAGTWAHLVLTHEPTGANGRLTLHLNWLDPASGAARNDVESASVKYARDQAQVQPLRIGAGQDGQGDAVNFFSGRIDEVALYNTVLTPTVVNAHFAMSRA